MSYLILTDSSANIPQETIKKNNIDILSLTFLVNGEEHLAYDPNANEDERIKHFYGEMRNKVDVTTSCINSEHARDHFEKLLSQGNDILYISFSSGLTNSFTVTSGVLEELKLKYPERKILYVDSLGASLGQGILVLKALELKNEGMSIEDLKQWLEDNKLNVYHMFTVDDLWYLKKGGRLKGGQYILAKTLNIKPVLHMDDEGHLIALKKALGRKQSLSMLVKALKNTIVNSKEQTIAISHGDCLDDAKYVADLIKEQIEVKDIIINYVDLTIGAHSGPGTVALFYFGGNRMETKM